MPGWPVPITGLAGRSASSFLYGYWADFPADGYEWFYGEGLTAGAIPTNAGLTCVFIGAPPARIHQLVNERSPLVAFHGAGRTRRVSDRGFMPPLARNRSGTSGHCRPAISAPRTGRAGRWSGMPATGSTR